jgi:hypothetical protein
MGCLCAFFLSDNSSINDCTYSYECLFDGSVESEDTYFSISIPNSTLHRRSLLDLPLYCTMIQEIWLPPADSGIYIPFGPLLYLTFNIRNILCFIYLEGDNNPPFSTTCSKSLRSSISDLDAVL